MAYHLSAVGSFGPRDRWNPAHVIRSLGAWPLLEALSRRPATAPALDAAFGEQVRAALDHLAELGVVKESAGAYRLGFAWFTAADQEAIAAAAAPVAAELADKIHDRRRQFEVRSKKLTAAAWTDPADLRFAVVGCFGLDWGGLEALKATGQLAHHRDQPGGRQYIMFVEEDAEHLLPRVFRGSRRVTVGGKYTWTSFGDDVGSRFGLPDLLWAPPGTAPVAEAALAPAAEALVALTQGAEPDETGRRLAEEVGALRDGRPAVPVFFARADGATIGQIVKMIQMSVVEVITERYDDLQESLAGLTPLRHGVPFAECFNHVWHSIFGQANRLLADRGFLANPQPGRPGEGHYRWWLTVGE